MRLEPGQSVCGTIPAAHLIKPPATASMAVGGTGKTHRLAERTFHAMMRALQDEAERLRTIGMR